jgi:CTP synthase (UTP-ammonia lyase)
MKRIHVGLVGDFSANKHTHVALNDCIEHCRKKLHFELIADWIPTPDVNSSFLADHPYKGFWFTPGSPYANDAGVYEAVRWSRENNFPAMGTCGGFQYMVVEYARNVIGIKGADHEESEPNAEQLIISKMSCSLKGQQEEVHITDLDSWLYKILKTNKITGHFNCSYGVNPAHQRMVNQYPFVFTAFSPTGEARAFELKAHRFYRGTLFQPPLESSFENPNPLVLDFLHECSFDA